MEAMGIIFSNIYDSKMGNLTWERTSGSIPFGGRYRQIDFVLSNMSNSGIRNIGIITKYNYQSLMDHLANCEDWDLHLGENVRFLPPYATGHTGAYRGKLEALQTALPVLERSDAEYVILSDTTVLCAIDFAEVVDAHVASGCDLTVVAKAGRADGSSCLCPLSGPFFLRNLLENKGLHLIPIQMEHQGKLIVEHLFRLLEEALVGQSQVLSLFLLAAAL